jgi:putative ABC transport system permease protein
MPSWDERLYRRLLSILPRGFRCEAERELIETFRQARARAADQGRRAQVRFWMRTTADLVVTARAERRARRSATTPDLTVRPAYSLAFVSDVRLAVRTLARTPGFTAAAILTFTLGIGVNVAVVSVVDRMMFRPLPYGEADRLVHVHSVRSNSGPAPESFLPEILTASLRAHSQSFEGIASADGNETGVVFEGMSSPLEIDQVSHNLLRVLRVRPIAGRDFTVDDSRQPVSGDRSMLITEEVWRSHFARSREVFSHPYRTMAEGTPVVYRIVGVLPRGFLVPASALGERRHAVVVGPDEEARPNLTGPSVVARLRDGTTIAQARAEVEAVRARLVRQFPEGRWLQNAVNVEPIRAGVFWFYRPYVWLILAGVSAVFLVACANLATLSLARARSRQHIAAIQSALGASRGRVIAAAFAETAVVCAAGAGIALAVCYAVFDQVLRLLPAALRGVSVTPLDLRLIAMTAIGALGAAALAGSLPAFGATRIDIVSGLRRETRSGRATLHGRATLLFIEAALGVLLVTAAAVAGRSFLGLILKSPGYEAAGLYVLRVPHGFERGQPRFLPHRVQTAVDVIRGTHGIEAAGAANGSPVGSNASAAVNRDTFWRARGASGVQLGVGGHFFQTLRTPILAGREFTDRDLDGPAMVAIVNRTGARRLWPAGTLNQAVGQLIDTADGSRAIVGVVADMQALPGQAALPSLFVPLTAPDSATARSSRLMTMAIRMTRGRELDLKALETRLSDRMGTADGLVVSKVADGLPAHLQRPRFQAVLFGSLAVIGLLLAVVGLYAVAAFDVARRRFELGVRMALGASTTDIRRLVIRDAVRPVLFGTAAGLAAAWWAGQFLQAFVFEIDARDPWTLGSIALVLVAAAVLATWLPANRAAQTDPTTVLRAS